MPCISLLESNFTGIKFSPGQQHCCYDLISLVCNSRNWHRWSGTLALVIFCLSRNISCFLWAFCFYSNVLLKVGKQNLIYSFVMSKMYRLVYIIMIYSFVILCKHVLWKKNWPTGTTCLCPSNNKKNNCWCLLVDYHHSNRYHQDSASGKFNCSSEDVIMYLCRNSFCGIRHVYFLLAPYFWCKESSVPYFCY
jgi:hypothetical protein